jgi:hypothetical protein
VLLKLAVGTGFGFAVGADHQGGDAGCACIDSENCHETLKVDDLHLMDWQS